LEVLLNAGEVELLDVAVLQEQLLTLIWRGNRIDHQPGDHDDYANAAAGVIVAVKSAKAPVPWGVMAAVLEARPRQNIGFF